MAKLLHSESITIEECLQHPCSNNYIALGVVCHLSVNVAQTGFPPKLEQMVVAVSVVGYQMQ